MAVGQRVAARLWVGGHVVHVQDRPDCLVLEPLAGVAGMDAGSLGQLGRGRRAALRQRPVQPEPIAEVHSLQVEGSERGAHQAAGELVAAGLGGGIVRGDGHRWHSSSSATADSVKTPRARRDGRTMPHLAARLHGHPSISTTDG